MKARPFRIQEMMLSIPTSSTHVIISCSLPGSCASDPPRMGEILFDFIDELDILICGFEVGRAEFE
jgi:hypothetical protein